MKGLAVRILLLATLALVVGTGTDGAHEERLLVGRVEAIEPARKLIVLIDATGGARRRLEVNPETEVIACRRGAGLGVLPVGALVRVKYLERAGASSEATSILLLTTRRDADARR